MTQEIFATDAYARETEAEVVEVRAEGLVLDRTVFYVRGGGQPGDTGWLTWEGGRARVADTFRLDGVPVHAVEEQAPPAGARVTGTIDWDRRHLRISSERR